MGGEGQEVVPSRRLEELIHLAELCVDLLQQNEDHYAEVKCFALSVLAFVLRVYPFVSPSSVNCSLGEWTEELRFLRLPSGLVTVSVTSLPTTPPLPALSLSLSLSLSLDISRHKNSECRLRSESDVLNLLLWCFDCSLGDALRAGVPLVAPPTHPSVSRLSSSPHSSVKG